MIRSFIPPVAARVMAVPSGLSATTFLERVPDGLGREVPERAR